MKVYNSIIRGLEEAIIFERGEGTAKTKRFNKPTVKENIKLTIAEKPIKNDKK